MGGRIKEATIRTTPKGHKGPHGACTRTVPRPRAVSPGWFYNKKRGKLEYSTEVVETDREKSDTERTSDISQDCEWGETARHLSDLSNCLKISGYSAKENFNTI